MNHREIIIYLSLLTLKASNAFAVGKPFIFVKQAISCSMISCEFGVVPTAASPLDFNLFEKIGDIFSGNNITQ